MENNPNYPSKNGNPSKINDVLSGVGALCSRLHLISTHPALLLIIGVVLRENLLEFS